MSSTPVQLAQVNDVLAQTSGVFTYLPKITVPHTTIVNRAQCVDTSADHLPKFGVNRSQILSIEEVQGEAGPNGEMVFKPINDSQDSVRLYGPWNSSNASGSRMSGATSSASGSNYAYMEITFYGTGLNLLTLQDLARGPLTYSVDGGSFSADIFPSSTSTVIRDRNYAANQILPVVGGLTLGTHTILLKAGSSLELFGYEVLNTASTLQLVSGSSYVGAKKASKAALSTDAYNSNFESGALSSIYGGHVVVYQKPDGTVKKAVQSNAGGALYLTSANHASETVIRYHSHREFGAGRSDDFSTLGTSATNVAFTLDDGTTTLTGSSVVTQNVNGTDCLIHGALNSTVTLTFVGTGLSLSAIGNAGTADTYTLTVDGVNQGSFSSGTGIVGTGGTYPLVSGLAYGTHTIKLQRTTFSGVALCIKNFIVYGPAKPSVPAGAVELCDYYLMGSYVANTTVGIDTIGTGILRKFNTREFVYAGTWSATIQVGDIGGWEILTSTINDSATYTFFGTGFEFRFGSTSTAQTITLSVDGSSNLSGATTSAYGVGTSIVASTGVVTVGTSNANGLGVSVSGLTLGLHTVKIQKTSGATPITVQALDIITPVHSPKGNLPGDLQNTQSVGSNALGDSRKFPAQSVKVLANWVQAVGIANSPTTTSTSNVPVPDMAVTIKTSGNPIRISYAIDTNVTSTTSNIQVQYQIYVDGNLVGPSPTSEIVTNNNTNAINYGTSSASIIWPVTAGVHAVAVYWNTGGGTINARGTARILTVKEEN